MRDIRVELGPELKEAIKQGGRGEAEDTAHKTLTAHSPEPPRTPGAAAFYGLAGEIVREIEPQSEADPAAILVQILIAVGSAVGRGPGFVVEADRHHCNLFGAIVGATASARKGSSWGQARRPVEAADAPWSERISTGASSGEGLIWEVRDEIEETRKARKDEDGDEHGFVTELADIGVEDKRLLVIEPELASVLERMQRDGNTLSAVLRQGWDGGKLDTLVKTNRATATDAHVSLIGHITAEELRRKLTETESANGFANRFLWVYARRSKSLPFGGNLDAVDWDPYIERLHEAIRYGSTTGALDMDAEARKLWVEHYPRLSAGCDGLLGAVTARGPAQVRRLAVIYSLLDPVPDGTPIVTVDHLRAALALWEYCFESAAFIFGDALGDPTADAILAQLRSNPEGMTRKAISDAFGRHRRADDLDRALGALEERELAFSRTEPTKGRPAIRWFAATSTSEKSEESEVRPLSERVSSHSSLSSQGENGDAS
jgi:hypothetical protein